MSRLASLCLLVLALDGLAAADGLPTAVAAADPALRYVGRFEMSAAGARCAWPASKAEFRFDGTRVGVEMEESGKDVWQVEVDGRPGAVLALQPGRRIYVAAEGLAAGEHTVSLTKRTEAQFGTTTFVGLRLEEGARLLPVPPADSPRRIEVVGDSISCGYGNEAGSAAEHFSPATENVTLTYEALAARRFHADYLCVAWSGKKLWPNNSILDLYDRTLPGDPASRWDFSRWIPDAVVVNLGANDFANKETGNPDRAGWTGAYEAFVARLRRQYPDATIYCALNPLTSDDWPPGNAARTTLAAYLDQVVADLQRGGDAKVRLLPFARPRPEDGEGADHHPSQKTHRLMADRLEEALASDLGWN